MTGKKETLDQFLRKAANKTSKTIAQSLFFQFAVGFLAVSYAITC